MTDFGQPAASSEDDLAIRRKRALYRAQHRGTKEMDWMLGRYAAAKLDTMTGDELALMEGLLEAADPNINSWLIEPQSCPEAAFDPLIADIRAFHSMI